MHKPIFFIVMAEHEEVAKELAERHIQERLIDLSGTWGTGGSSYDWYQGIKESGRWPEYEDYDRPIKISMNTKALLRKLIRLTQTEYRYWKKEADKVYSESKFDGPAAIFYHAIGNPINHFLFDLTDYSMGSAISSNASLDKLDEYLSKQQCDDPTRPAWLVGFDIHY